MWITSIALLALVSAAVTAPITLCPQPCICTPSGAHLEARCKSFDFLKLNLSAAQIDVLATLDISNGTIIKINPNLKNLSSLKRINLSLNKIQHITAASLPKSLQYLDLSNNYIKYLPEDVYLLQKLREIELYGNPITCDCSSITVRDKLLKNGVVFKHPVKCAFPETVKGQLWQSVNCKDDLSEEMQGDAPLEGSGSEEEEEDPLVNTTHVVETTEKWDSSIENEFIPVGSSSGDSVDTLRTESNTDNEIEFEGSGDVTEIPAVNYETENKTEANTKNVTLNNDYNEEDDEDDEEDDEEDDDDEEDEDYDDDDEDYEDDLTQPEEVTSIETLITSFNKSSLNTNLLQPCNFNCSTPNPIEISNETDASPGPNLIEGLQIIAKDLGIIEEHVPTTKPPEIVTTTLKQEETTETTTISDIILEETTDAQVIVKTVNIEKGTENIVEEPKHSSNTFIFLGVLVAIIMCLIAFVLIKRRYTEAINNELGPDGVALDAKPEEMELLKQPEKPKVNGNQEAVPLINGHSETPAKIVDNEIGNELKEPKEDEEDVELRPKITHNKINASPETKRVTVKATEIPDSSPQTPILVTRHIDSDGSVITTPAIEEQV